MQSVSTAAHQESEGAKRDECPPVGRRGGSSVPWAGLRQCSFSLKHRDVLVPALPHRSADRDAPAWERERHSAAVLWSILAWCCLAVGGWLGPAPSVVAAPSCEAQILEGQELLYHGRFDAALAIFSDLQASFPDDPRPYFLQALTYRWLARIDPESEKRQQQFEKSIGKSIAVSGTLLKHDAEHVHAVLVLAASYGYRAEYYQFQKDRWNKAYDDAVRMRDYLDRAKELEQAGNIDVQLGLGLYNYYAYVYRKKIGWWNFLVSLPKGDKERGIAQIQTVREQGTYLRVEAWYFLTEIFKSDDDYGEYAIPTTKALHEAYPEHPYFHIFLAGLYHARQDWRNSLRTAQAVLESAKHSPYYSDYIIYQATYLVGESSFYLGHYDDALAAFDVIVAKRPAKPAYLLPWSHLRRGTIYSLTEKKARAIEEYQQVFELDDALDVHALARGFLDRLEAD